MPRGYVEEMAQLPCWPPRGQQVSHQRWISGNMYCNTYASAKLEWGRTHSGFETKSRRHQKSETGVSVAPQKELMSSKNFFKKKALTPPYHPQRHPGGVCFQSCLFTITSVCGDPYVATHGPVQKCSLETIPPPPAFFKFAHDMANTLDDWRSTQRPSCCLIFYFSSG